MRENMFETNVINLKKKRLARRYKALYSLLLRVKMLFSSRFEKPSIGKSYKRTMNH